MMTDVEGTHVAETKKARCNCFYQKNSSENPAFQGWDEDARRS
jgi:hypothetical protein